MALEFNSSSSIHPREWTVLKNCWDNLKKKAKQYLTQKNQHFLGTGGGPPKKFDDDPMIARVLELIQARVSGFVNYYDSDGTLILDTNSCGSQLLSNELQIATTCTETETGSTLTASTSSELQSNELQIACSGRSTEENTTFRDWSQYTPSMLRDSRNQVLCPSPETLLLVDQQLPTQATMDAPTLDTANNTITPQRNNPHGGAVPAAVSRRRPVLRSERDAQSLAHERIKVLIKANMQAEEQHDVQMKILRLQEQKEEVSLQKEKEILEQEKLKTLQEQVKLEICQYTLMKLKD